MIEKKVTQLHKRMRRLALDQHFNNIRNTLLRDIEPQIYNGEAQVRNEVIRCLNELGKHLQKFQYHASRKYLEYLFQKKACYDNISALLFQESEILSAVFKVAINNTVSAKNSYKSLCLDFMYRFLELVYSLDYLGPPNDKFLLLLNVFWMVFLQKQIQIYSNQRMLLLSLHTVKKMLETQTIMTFNGLKNIGLGNKLVMIFDSEVGHCSREVTKILIQILEQYLEQEVSFYNNNQQCKIGDIQILGFQSNQKTMMMAYCLSIIKLKKQELLLQALNCLNIIFKKYEYLSCQITVTQIKFQLLEMIQSPVRNIKHKSIILLDLIIFHNKEASKYFLENMILPDILQQILALQHKKADLLTEDIVTTIAYIICNLTIGADITNTLKKQYMNHFIWDFAYQHIYPGSQLIQLVVIFEYYFQKGSKYKFVQSYILAVSQLKGSQLPLNIEANIQKTIIKLYNNNVQDFWNPEKQERFSDLLKSCGLFYIIEELVPQQANDTPL